MTSALTLRITLYGALRGAVPGGVVTLEAPRSTTTGKLRIILESELRSKNPDFPHHKLLEDSVFADAKSVFNDDTVLETDAELALLPPVCGG